MNPIHLDRSMESELVEIMIHLHLQILKAIQFKFNTRYWWWFHIFKWLISVQFIQCYFSYMWNIYIILIHLYHSISIPSNIIERGNTKLPPFSFSIDCNEGRSIFIQFKSFYYYFALSIHYFRCLFFHIMQPHPIW